SRPASRRRATASTWSVRRTRWAAASGVRRGRRSPTCWWWATTTSRPTPWGSTLEGARWSAAWPSTTSWTGWPSTWADAEPEDLEMTEMEHLWATWRGAYVTTASAERDALAEAGVEGTLFERI